MINALEREDRPLMNMNHYSRLRTRAQAIRGFTGHLVQRGFTLIEMMLALGIIIVVGGIILQNMKRDVETSQSKAVGQSMKTQGEAMNSYIAIRYNTLVTHTPGTDDMPCTSMSNCGTAADPGPRTCEYIAGTTDRRCFITSETLRRNSLVPNSFSGRNPYGSHYVYEIVITGAAPNWIVNGMVTTREPYTSGSTVRYDLLGQAMMEAGADSGMTKRSSTIADGYNGTWAESGYQSLDKLGLLVFRAGYSSNAYAAYLRRDGTTPMTGSLDMDGHDILNVKDMAATGTVEAGNLRALANAANALSFGSAGSETAMIGPSLLSGQTILALRNANKVRIEDMNGNVGNLETGDIKANSVTAYNTLESGGTLRVTTDANIGGSLTVGTPAPASSPGGITANGRIMSLSNVTAPVMYVGNGTNNTGWLSDKALNFAADSGTFRGFWYDPGTTSIIIPTATDLRVTGSMSTDNNFTARTGQFYEGLQVGNNIINFDPVNHPAPGATCTAFRTVVLGSNNALMQCVQETATDGVWRTMQGLGKTLIVQSPTAVCSNDTVAQPPAVATCPAGYPNVVSGGYAQASGVNAPRWGPTQSFQNGNAWYVYAGVTDPYGGNLAAAGGHLTTPSCWYARVTCAQN